MSTEGPKRARRSLTHVGGEVDTEGDEADARQLAHALDVARAAPVAARRPLVAKGELRATESSDEPEPSPMDTPTDEADRAHVHGFHAYPARMHPVTASRLVRAFAPRDGVVFDPFCGSGTVLVEALLASRRALGTDLNPLAVRLARAKTRPREDEELTALVARARACAGVASERRRARAGASRWYPDEDVRLFNPHVLLELDGLRLAIEGVDDPSARADLELVLSALLIKVSRRLGDTSEATAPRRLAAGYTAKLFVKKTEEFARRLHEFTRRVPNSRHERLPALGQRVSVEVDDATILRSLSARDARTGAPRAEAPRIDAVITSPPYAATYDYLEHHALRLRWLGIDTRPLAGAEMGSRRRYAPLSFEEARHTWAREVGTFLDALARVLQPGAPLVLLMADSAVGERALRADEIVLDLAGSTGFDPAARASQVRPHFHGPTQRAFSYMPRREHALLLRRR